MKSSLRTHHQLIIIAILLLVHGGMLTILIMQMNANKPFEPIIMMEQQENEPFPEHDWVAMNNSMPYTQMVAQQSDSVDSVAEEQKEQQLQEVQEEELPASPKEAPKQETIDEQAFDDAMAVATEVLKKESVAETKKEEPKKPFDKLRANGEEKKSFTQQRAALTLAQLAQGFSEQLQQADMAVRSDRGGVANIDQIKHINYCQKIISCLVNSYKIHNHNCTTKLLKNRARIHLALNKNGSIYQLAIQQSSGDPGVDQFLLHMFKDAASSFPPVPEALHADPYHLPTFTIDNLESFRSQQGWYIDNRI